MDYDIFRKLTLKSHNESLHAMWWKPKFEVKWVFQVIYCRQFNLIVVVHIFSVPPTSIPNHLFNILKIRLTSQIRKSQIESSELWKWILILHLLFILPPAPGPQGDCPPPPATPSSATALVPETPSIEVGLSAIVIQVWLEFLRSLSPLWSRFFPGARGAGQVLSGVRAEEASGAVWFLSFPSEGQEGMPHTVRWRSGRAARHRSLFEQINVEPTCQDYGFGRP